MCAAPGLFLQRCQIEIPIGDEGTVHCGSMLHVEWIPLVELYACELCRERFNLISMSKITSWRNQADGNDL